ncbi:unnamed protein product [Fraxinus pennsylvanica]|uniref:Cupin type-1 domain-containing protein n=1 Tax=Fraxinus pennsylvanica TaxID=56036 RepID=A0AAD2DLH7_9LAMI|nr:unnamed protein product [Fraxinus pennsylvanica]
MAEKSTFLFSLLFSLLFICIAVSVNAHGAYLEEKNDWVSGPHLVKKEERKSIVSTEDGEISSVWIPSRPYHLQFITLEPNSLLLPVLLHTDMVFYVHTGSGDLSWTDKDELKHADLRRGDVYRLHPGTVFFIQSSLETERSKLRIHAIFMGSDDFPGQTTEAYSSIRDLVLGFDKKVLQAAFQVPEEVIYEMLNGTKPPAIVHGFSRTKRTAWEMEAQFIRDLIGSRGYNIFESNRKKRKTTKLFNIFSEDKDFKNCNGWSTTVTRKKLSALKGSEISVFMVNLTAGSMMGPHWNPRATEIAVVLQGQGMIRVVCSSISSETECKNARLKVEEGDVFAVPRFHPMAQMAFNNGTFVFMGFSTSAKKNHPQFLAGKASVLRTLDKEALAASFNIDNTTLDRLLAPQRESVILDCTSCAEEELRLLMEEIEKEKEAERKREQEEARKEAEEKRRKQEEARKREEEKARKEEEERRKREEEEEARKREEEKARKEEEERRKREEEEAKRRAEEEARKRQEEEAKRREQEQEEARKREEEEAKRRAEEEARKRQEEEAKRREQEQEEARKREEEAARKEEEERRKREEAAAAAKRREEEEARQQEEAKKREQEQAAKEEEEARRREEEQQEAQRREEEAARWRQQQEEEAKRRAEEEARKRQEEQEGQAAKEEEEARRREEEQQEAQRREKEAARWRQQQEEAKRRAEEEARKRQEEQERPQPGRGEEEQAAEQERKRQEAQREEEAARQRGGGGQQVYA